VKTLVAAGTLHLELPRFDHRRRNLPYTVLYTLSMQARRPELAVPRQHWHICLRRSVSLPAAPTFGLPQALHRQYNICESQLDIFSAAAFDNVRAFPQ